MKPGPDSRSKTEVEDADPTLLRHPREIGTAARTGALGSAVGPLELLGGHDGYHPRSARSLRPIEIGAHMIELAVIPTGAVGLVQRQDRDVMTGGERLDVPPDPLPIFSMIAGDPVRLPR
jgi:hypothetical protein